MVIKNGFIIILIFDKDGNSIYTGYQKDNLYYLDNQYKNSLNTKMGYKNDHLYLNVFK
jgi:hypothetical protein